MTSELFCALDTLTRPLSETRDARCTQQEALLTALRENRSLLLEQLREQGGLEVARRLRAEVLAGQQWFSDTGDVPWDFVQESLLLLLALARHLSSELERFHQTAARPGEQPRGPEMAPPLPPDVLSVSQQKTVAAALQFVVCLGVCPYLAPGVGLPLRHRSAFGALVEKVVQGGGVASATHRLWTTTTVLLKLAELSSLATLVVTRHLGDLMAALSQLGHQPLREDGLSMGVSRTLAPEQRLRCREALRRLLGQVYQPVVITELLLLQGAPRQARPAGGGGGRLAPSWLRCLCGQLLSERLIQPSGVQAVVRAVLELGSGGESDWRTCDSVAKILAACPQQAQSADRYYEQVCPQILDLLHFSDKLTAMQFQRVATRAVLCMVQEKPGLAQQKLLTPLLAPLSRCTSVSGRSHAHNKNTEAQAGEGPTFPHVCADAGDCVEEEQLTRCVEDVYKVWVVGNSGAPLLRSALQPVLPVLFAVFCFSQKSVTHLRAQCEQILLWFLRQADPAAALLTLKQLCGLQPPLSWLPPGFRFSAGSEGGVRLSRTDTCSDEEEDLFERVSEEQWRLECLMKLLAQLTDQDLPGDFFLDLLQELNSVASAAAAAADEDEPQAELSAMSLLEVEQKTLGGSERLRRRLVLLQVLAVMVETLQHTLLLRRHAQVVGFMESLLQRACVGLEQPSPAQAIESQTLSMGLGLVATLLSAPQGVERLSGGGDAPSTSQLFSSVSSLLAPLLTLSEKHPDLFIRELASNLRALIASRGTCGAPSSGSRSRSGGGGGAEPTFSECVMEACHPDVPTRAVALRVLTRMLQSREPPAVKEKEKLLLLFLENLEHEDSFVYLSAVQGLAALADCFPEKILQRLLAGFQHSAAPSSRSVESRLKMGEVLMRASRAMGDLAPHLGRPLIAVFLRGARDPDHGVRASSLSNLGELCQRLDYALLPLVQELSSCLTALIKTEKEVEVRRAAVHVVTVLLRGLADKTTQVLTDVLLDLYRALKLVARSDPDPVSVLHAQLALEELDLVMRRFIFPQQKLEKKIVVLP
ncbi:transport and Golgi organization protein 6 homolog isoform X2 [Synchiropus splendidus]|uniref:transport and Golgi organization protein 6 homolog isoform X2 n=1 Tax=Synchiropus splendidus TaxID=270530 RepID=UPI00237D8947|nr:transport and Golgi organization protein 6 homolog isoform X2 [Synchiropus splendidus]